MRLGFFERINGREVIGHLGDTEFFHTSLHLLMKEGVGVYFSFNSGGREGIVQTVRWSLFEDFADRYSRDRGGGVPVDQKTAAEHAAHDGRQLAGKPLGLQQSDRRAESHRPDQGGCRAERRAADSGTAWCEANDRVSGKRSRHSSGARRAGDDLLAAKVEDGKVVRWSFGLLGPSWCSTACRRIVPRAGSCRPLPSALAFCC